MSKLHILLSEEENPGPKAFITTRAPSVHEAFLRDLPDNAERKENLDYMAFPCSNLACGKDVPRKDLKLCGRCKIANYCSPECQKLDWRAGHKQKCEASQDLALKLAIRALAVPKIVEYLMAGSICFLDLEKERKNAADFLIRVRVTTLFADIMSFVRRKIEGLPDDHDAQVLLHVKGFEKVPYEEAPLRAKADAHKKREEYKSHRLDVEGRQTFGRNPVVTFFFVSETEEMETSVVTGGQDGSVVFTMVIPEWCLKAVKAKEKVLLMSSMAGNVEKELTTELAREILNNFIRLDKENVLKLRGYRPKKPSAASSSS